MSLSLSLSIYIYIYMCPLREVRAAGGALRAEGADLGQPITMNYH